MLAVGHHRHGELHPAGVQLGPGVEHAVPQERDVADHLVWICLKDEPSNKVNGNMLTAVRWAANVLRSVIQHSSM